MSERKDQDQVGMELNLTNLKDLEYICEAAAVKFRAMNEIEWTIRATKYRAIFSHRIADWYARLRLDNF